MSKIVCGIDIEGSTAIVIILKGTKQSHSRISTKFNKIELKEHKSQAEIHSFRLTVFSHFFNENVSIVGIKGRATKGQFSGGPISFKIEGLIQTVENIPVEIISPSTIAATLRKHPINVENLGINKYQYNAYKVAYHLLED